MKRKLLLAVFAALVGLFAKAQTWTGNPVEAGTFYLYNVGADKFLNNGDPAQSWGTNAYLQAGFGLDVVLAKISDGVYTIDTNVSNGGDSHYLANSTWCDGGATNWTFRAVDGETNVYQIIFDGQYLMATEALNDIEMVGDPGSRTTSTYWKLVSENDFKAAMVAKEYSAENPMDVSVFIKGRSFARNDGRNNSWTTTHNGGNWTWIGASDNKYFGNESWNNTFDVHQTITGLPEGTYEVRCSGFGTNGTTYIYGNTTTGLLQTDNTTSYGNSKEAKWKAIHEDNAFAGQSTGLFAVGDGNLTVGIKRETNKSGDWCVWDEFRLYYYGLDLSEFSSALATAVAAAEAVEGTVPTVVYTALSAVVTEQNKTYTSAAEYTAATNAIVEATNAAKALQAPYSRYTTIKAAALAIAADLDTTGADEEMNAATTAEALEAAIVTLRAAFLAELPNVSIPNDPGYIDVTSVMVDNASVSANVNYWTTEKTSGNGPTTNYGETEFYNANFKFYQTLAMKRGTWEFGVTGFHRGGQGDYSTYFYAGDDKILIPGVESSVVNTMAAAKDYFDAGNGKVALKFVIESDQNVEIGIINQDTQTDKWTIFRDFTLKYFGAPDYTVYIIPYSEALDAAKAFTEPSMFASDWETLQAAISSNTLDLESPSLTKASLITATENLNAAVAAATSAVANYTTYYNVVAAIGEKTNVDLTEYVTNAGFEEGTLTGWTSVDGGNVANNGNFGRHQGTWFAERWKNGVALGNGSLTHDAIVLPAGVYRVTVDAQNIEQYNGGAAGTGLFLYANEERTEIGASANYAVYVKLADKTPLTIKFVQDNCTGNWISYDNVTLTYVDEDYVYALVDGKMNATVAAAQTAAKDAFTGNQNGETYQALMTAIAAAQASKDAYTAAAAALTKANDILNSTNIYTTEARTTYADAIAAAQAAYDENSMDDATANGLNAALNTASWGAAQTLGAAYIGSAWTGTNIGYNFWSWEGDGEGASGMSSPFVQYWVADAEKLADNTITASVTGLENGLYSVTAFMRAFNNKEGDDAGYDGISLAVNEGTPVVFAEATAYSDGYAKEITAEGLVKDGNLVIKVAIEGTNASWLAFKNVNYTKVRDLTPEEEAVAPTAIALYVGEEEVTEVALNKDNMTVTLTPSYTPADATEGVTWTSSDETVATVADGVVTAVLPGTATITATSTIDPTVSASVIVTVTFPESTVPATYYVNDGSTRTVYTLGENLIKNGSFEYPNAVYGWTTGTGSVNPMSTSNFNVPTEGAADGNQYLQAKESKGGADAKSINTSWPLEDGKTYVFGYKIKANKQCTTDLGYIGTSLSNTKGSENGNKKFETPAYGTEWQDVTYTFTNTDNYKYLVFNARWMANAQSFDNFYLAEATYKLEGNVDYATAAIPTANIGTGAFQYSQDAIDAANALVQGEATVEDVEAAYEAVTTLNAPEETQAYNLVFNCKGHSADGNALTLIPNPAQSQGLYGLKYLAPANVNLAQAFYFVHTTGNKYKVFAIDNDLNERYITTQAEGYGTTWYDGIRTIDDASKAMEIEIRPNGEGLYLLWNTGANKAIAHNGNNNNDFFTNNTADFQFVETSKPSIAINTTAAGWGTVMLPFAQALPEGVKAYSVEFLDGDKLMLEDVDALEANKPYIIEGAWNEIVTGDAQGTALKYTDGLLTGVYESQEATEGTYILQKQDEVVGFFLVDYTDWAYENKPQVKANRAYLTTPGGAGVKAFILGGNDETAIKSVFDGVANGDIYDLGGRKVQRMQKGGVYVVNGKKVIVK